MIKISVEFYETIMEISYAINDNFIFENAVIDYAFVHFVVLVYFVQLIDEDVVVVEYLSVVHKNYSSILYLVYYLYQKQN